MGPVHQEPRAAGPGANISGNNSERSLCHRQRSRWRFIRVAAQILSDQGPRPGEKIQKGGAGRQAAGRTNIASGLFVNGRGQQKWNTGLYLLRVARAGVKNSNSFENGSSSRLTFSAPTRPPLPKVVETGYAVLASTGSSLGRPVWCSPGAGVGKHLPPLLLPTGFSQVTRGDKGY